MASYKFGYFNLKSLLKVVFCLFLAGCAFGNKQIGEKQHSFSERPTKIIWFQIPGLSINHFSLVKLTGSIIEQGIPLESAVCTGRGWNYSLYEVSPNFNDEMEIQLSGSTNSKKKCEEKSYLWKDLLKYGFTSGVYQRDQSGRFLKPNSSMCIEKELNNIVLWRSGPKLSSEKTKPFHFLERDKSYFLDNIYVDKSCSKGQCFSDFSKTVETIYEDFFKKRKFHFLTVQDFTYKDLIMKKDFAGAKEYMLSLLNTLNYFNIKRNEGLLVLFSFVEPIELMLPPTGKQWSKIFDQIKVNPAKLHSEVLAWGAGSEKFCGIYHSADMKSKILRAIETE